jgi:hypothetical protein
VVQRPGWCLGAIRAAPGALVAADRDQQGRRSPAQRLVHQPPGDRVARAALAAAAPTPLVRLGDPAGQDRPTRLEPLPEDFQAELVQAAERGQVRASEASVKHVEVFRMGSVRTPILRRPRPLPGHRRAARYTLICEEPKNGGKGRAQRLIHHQRRKAAPVGGKRSRPAEAPADVASSLWCRCSEFGTPNMLCTGTPSSSARRGMRSAETPVLPFSMALMVAGLTCSRSAASRRVRPLAVRSSRTHRPNSSRDGGAVSLVRVTVCLD